MFLSSLSHHNKDLEQQTLKPSARHSSRVLDKPCYIYIPLRQISVTALFYLEDSRRIDPQSMRACQPKDSNRREWRSAWGGGGGEVRERKSVRTHARRRERARKHFGSSFYMFFPSPGPALCKLGLARSAVYSTRSLHSGPRTSLGPSFVLFSGAFPFLVF